jgi:hypothetical protein
MSMLLSNRIGSTAGHALIQAFITAGIKTASLRC